MVKKAECVMSLDDIVVGDMVKLIDDFGTFAKGIVLACTHKKSNDIVRHIWILDFDARIRKSWISIGDTIVLLARGEDDV